MRWTVIDRWHTNAFLAKCFADNIRKELQKLDEDKRKEVFILFSAHSLPLQVCYAIYALLHKVIWHKWLGDFMETLYIT